MNCAEFANIVVDLAQSEMRGVLLTVEMKQRGWQHAQSCVPCAGRLKLEQSLSRSLRTVAAGDQSLSAPASVETALLAAFRAREDAVPLAANVIVPTFRESPWQLFFGRLKWSFAALAGITFVALAVSYWLQPVTPQQPLVAGKGETPTPTGSVVAPAPEPRDTPPPEERLVGQPDAPPRLAMPVKAPPQRLVSSRRRDRVTVEVGPFELDEPEAISAKDFLVFDYAQTLPPADSMQLMRVRMPRERLVPLGIPLPRETRNENFVNADFLVGSDGVPRAIRVANR
jgi:hypothetical protein